MGINRREFIKLSSLTTIGVAAGCTSPTDTDESDAAQGVPAPDATMAGGDTSPTDMDAPDAMTDATSNMDAPTPDAATNDTDTASTTDPDLAEDSESIEAGGEVLDDAVAEDLTTTDEDVSSPDDSGTSDDAATESAPPANRVVRIHCDQAHDWDFNNTEGNRHYDHINQSAINDMLDQGVLSLTGESNTTAAWRAIMRFNNPAGYVAGDRVAIKVNNNNSYADDRGEPNSGPEIISAVVASRRPPPLG